MMLAKKLGLPDRPTLIDWLARASKRERLKLARERNRRLTPDDQRARAREHAALYRRLAASEQCPVWATCPDCGRTEQVACALGRGLSLEDAAREVMAGAYPCRRLEEDVAVRKALKRLCRAHRREADAYLRNNAVNLFGFEALDMNHLAKGQK